MTWLRLLPGVFKMIPREVWYVLAAAFIFRLGVNWHEGRIKAHDTALIAARDAQWQVRLDEARQAAITEKKKGDAVRAALAHERSKKHEATVHTIVRTGDALRVSGVPEGAAAIDSGQGHHSGLSAAAGESDQRLRAGNAASDELPFDGAVVSWTWLIDAAQQCDINRAEARTWRDWYAEQLKAWPVK